MTAVQCFDGLGLSFLYEVPPSDERVITDFYSRGINSNFEGRLYRSIAMSLILSKELRLTDLAESPGESAEKLLRIRLGLDHIDNVKMPDEYREELFELRDQVDAYLRYFSVDTDSKREELRSTLLAKDSLDGLQSVTLNSLLMSAGWYRREPIGREAMHCPNTFVLVEMTPDKETKAVLRSVSKPHRLKSLIVRHGNNYAYIFKKPTLLFVWEQRDRFTIVTTDLDIAGNFKVLHGGKSQLSRLKETRIHDQRLIEEFGRGLLSAWEQLSDIDRLRIGVNHE